MEAREGRFLIRGSYWRHRVQCETVMQGRMMFACDKLNSLEQERNSCDPPARGKLL